MKTNKLWSILMMFVLVLGTTIIFSSCSKDDDNGNQNPNMGGGTWYTYKSLMNGISVKKSDFEEIEKAIDNHELLYRYMVAPGHVIETYAERSNFVYGDGGFSTRKSNHLGRLAGIVDGNLYAIRIVDDNTLVSCNFALYVDEDMNVSNNYTKVATIFKGHIFKSISLYKEENYYTYIKQGNKIFTTEGDIYTVTNDGLIKDGDSEVMVKFDPNSLYGLNQNSPTETKTHKIVGIWRTDYGQQFSIYCFNADGTGYSQDNDNAKRSFNYTYDDRVSEITLKKTGSSSEEVLKIDWLDDKTFVLYKKDTPYIFKKQ